jgi:ribosomal protein S18 acetylase RimI-like enzyme
VPIRPLDSLQELAALTDDDPLTRWAAQGFRTGARAWACGHAVAVASPALSGRDRLILRDRSAADRSPDALALAATAAHELAPGHRIMADRRVADGLLAAIPSLSRVNHIGWMLATAPPPDRPGRPGVGWLGPGDDDAVARLIEAAYPRSHAKPGRRGVLRWAGVRDPVLAGELAACTAEAWSAPGVGFVAGVASRADRRRAGAGEAAVAFVTRALVGAEGRAALMVDVDNAPAIALYRKLGYAWRELTGMVSGSS